MEGVHEVGTVGKKTMIKVHESYEPTELALGLGFRKVSNSLNFLWERGDAMTGDVMAQKIKFGDTEEALVRVDDDSVIGQTGKDSSQVNKMLLRIRAGNENIINVCIG